MSRGHQFVASLSAAYLGGGGGGGGGAYGSNQ